MDSFIVYSQDGKTERCILNQLEYNGEFMGACSVAFSISSPTPIDFQIGDYLIYREERFELNYIPTELKKSSKGTNGESFNYQDVQFNSLSDELVRCGFLDYVVGDNLIHYSSLPVFSFYAESINALAERIQVNLDRIYKGEKKWTVTVHPEYVNVSNKNITVDNISVWDALALANSEFKANFIVKDRTITIGTAGIAIGKLFSYGKGNGLYSIQKTAETDQSIITRLRAYGSTKNMPNRYYNKLSGSSPSNYLPNNMAVENLMLPDFPKITLDPYIDSPNIATLGIREGSVYFDGSGDLEEIYPSMEGITADQLRAAGISISLDEGDNGKLDEVADAEQLTDDGDIEEGENIPAFTITLKDIGFDINDYLTSEATISMKSGMCGGREFEIAQCEKVGNKYVLTCNRSYDESLKLYFPYKGYNIKPGDEFVLLHIDMPDVYIQAASQRLLTAAKDYLAKNDFVRYSYEPKVDDIFMARQHEEAVSRGEKSIHDTLKEGDLMLFEDTDLNINGSVIIQSLTINEGKSSIPSYEIILRNDKTVGTLEKIQNQIDSLSSGQGRGGFTTQQIESIIRAFGNKIFLSKTMPDQTEFLIKFLSGLECGDFEQGSTGVGIYKDEAGNWHIETDYLDVRMKFTAKEVEIQKVFHIGGSEIKSSASMKCIRVEELEDAYRCYMNTTDKDGQVIRNRFKVDDQAYVQTFNLERQADGTMGNHFLWRLVTAVGSDYIDLSKSVAALASDAPKAFDDIVQLGYRGTDDPSRQVAVIDAGAGEGAPYYRQYVGINSFHLPEPETQLKPGDNKLSGVLHIEKGSTGAANLSDLPGFIQQAQQMGTVNLLRNSGFTGDYETEELAPDTELAPDSEMYSKALEFWTGMATVQEDAEAVSCRSAVIGSLSQSVALINRELYVVSYKAKGESVDVSCGDFSVSQALTSDYQRYTHSFTFSGAGVFMLGGTATVCDVQLERGTIATDWKPSPLDNDKSMAEFQALSYIYDVLKNGSVDIIGGLILSSMIQLGNYKDGKMRKVTAGVSGVYNDDDDVYTWGGGTLEQAIRTVMKYKENPKYQPTPEELKTMANIVLTHGGRAILNDVIVRGYVYALGGYFRGAIEQADGFNKMNEDGSVSFCGGKIRWDKDGNPIIEGKVTTAVNGTRIEIDPADNSIKMYNNKDYEVAEIEFLNHEWGEEIMSIPRIRIRNRMSDGTDVSMTDFQASSISMMYKVGSDQYDMTIGPSIGIHFFKNGNETKHYSTN